MAFLATKRALSRSARGVKIVPAAFAIEIRFLTQYLPALKLFIRVAASRKGDGDQILAPKEADTNPASGPKTGRLTLLLNSTMESVAAVEAAADNLAAEAGLNEDERFHLTMAAREAAVNAVLHGNEYDPAKRVTASFENTGSALVITIADQGPGLDQQALPDPLAPENLLRGAGRGLFLIRSFMDEVRFRQLRPGTELTLVKHLPPVAGGSLQQSNGGFGSA
jgi:serine/threonine-protein kinase RsbW